MTGDGRTPLSPSHLSDARWRRLARLLARTQFGTSDRGYGGARKEVAAQRNDL